jgi:capsular polysaccharide biosynthesis protein
MTEPPLDLRATGAILRRGWIVILAFAVLGLCGGIAFGLTGRSQPSAYALVLVPTQASSSSAPTDDMSTQTVIAKSTAVLTPAINLLSPPVPANKLKVTVTAPASTNILRIQVQAPQPGQAVRLANAIANGYIRYVSKTQLISGQPILLQQASAATPPATSGRVATSGFLGLLTGLLLGAVVVFVRSRRDRRLRRRDDIADAIGLPVLATIEAGRYKTVTEWSRFLEHFQPSPTALWNLRRVINFIVRGHLVGDLTIRIVSYGDDTAALAAGPQLAMAAAELGISAQIVPGMQEALTGLRAASAQLNKSGYIERGSTPDTEDDDPWRRMWDARNQAHLDSQLVISILALERSDLDWSPFAGRSILAISAGAAVADELARLALAATEGGGDIDGIILVNPEPGDDGAGVIPHREHDPATNHLVSDYPGDATTVVAHP